MIKCIIFICFTEKIVSVLKEKDRSKNCLVSQPRKVRMRVCARFRSG